MNAVICAAGKGSRIPEMNKYKSKCLIPINNRLLIEYSLEYLAALGVKKAVIVIGHNGECVKERIGLNYKDILIKYIWQEKQLGIVNAINCAKDSLLEWEDDFVLCLGDEMYKSIGIVEFKDFFLQTKSTCTVLAVDTDNADSIKKTFSCEVDESNNIISLVEKPETVRNRIKGTGMCLMKKDMLHYIDKTPFNVKRNQYELVDLIMTAKKHGEKCNIFVGAEDEININEIKDLEMAESFVK